MSETNRELPGSVPGQFPETPGAGQTEGDAHDYIRDTGPFKSGTAGTAEGVETSAVESSTVESSTAGAGETSDDPHHYVRNTGPFKEGGTTQEESSLPTETSGTDTSDLSGAAAAGAAATGAAAAGGAGMYYASNDGSADKTEWTDTGYTSSGFKDTSELSSTGRTGTSFSNPTAGASEPGPVDDHGGYDRAGKGQIATEGELQNKFDTYLPFNDPDPARTAEMKEKIRQTEAQKAEMYGTSGEPPQEKKGGLLSKLGLGSKDKSSSGGDSSEAASEAQTELRRTSTGTPIEPDRGHILITQAGADGEGPVLVVKDDPGR